MSLAPLDVSAFIQQQAQRYASLGDGSSVSSLLSATA